MALDSFKYDFVQSDKRKDLRPFKRFDFYILNINLEYERHSEYNAIP